MAIRWPQVTGVRVIVMLCSFQFTVWNFAIHGTCWGPDQMMSNGDIMGGVNSVLETMNGGVAMFINGDAGDIAPSKNTRVTTYACIAQNSGRGKLWRINRFRVSGRKKLVNLNF